MERTKGIEFSAERMIGDWWAITEFGKLDGRSGPRGLQASSDRSNQGVFHERLAQVNYQIVHRELLTDKWKDSGMGKAIREAHGSPPKSHDRWPAFAADIIETAVEVYPTIRTEFED